MKIKMKPLIRTLAAVGGVGLLAVCGDKGCQKYKSEEPDRFVRAIDANNVPTGKNEDSYKFVKSLIDNKSRIQMVLDISDVQYRNFCYLAVGIAKAETNFGLDFVYRTKNFLSGLGCDRKVTKDEGLSLGLTNIKITDKGRFEQSIFKRLGVTGVSDPSESAVATIVHLKFLSDDYNKYLINIAPYQRNPLTMEEYVLARWKGYRLNTRSKNPSVRKNAESCMRQILADRTSQNPKNYVWKVLRSVGYTFDKTRGKVIRSN